MECAFREARGGQERASARATLSDPNAGRPGRGRSLTRCLRRDPGRQTPARRGRKEARPKKSHRQVVNRRTDDVLGGRSRGGKETRPADYARHNARPSQTGLAPRTGSRGCRRGPASHVARNWGRCAARVRPPPAGPRYFWGRCPRPIARRAYRNHRRFSRRNPAGDSTRLIARHLGSSARR
jgi:hypothetical protein